MNKTIPPNIIAFANNNRRFGNIKLGISPWVRVREIPALVSFLVTVTCLDQYRRTLILLGYRVFLLARDSGLPMAVQYLKEAVRLVIAVLSGRPDLHPVVGKVLVKRDSSGLPSIIPLFLRRQMLLWDKQVIKGVLSILSFYRLMRIPGVLKLHTVTDPITVPFGNIVSLQSDVMKVLSRYFSQWSMKYSSAFRWLFLVSAGPNGSHSTWCAPLDAVAFIMRPHLLSVFVRIAPWYVSLWLVSLGVVTLVLNIVTGSLKFVKLGRLHTFEEAAGKVRIVAITDWWSQCLLYPLHSFLFGILRTIEEDGTFDQHAPLRRLHEIGTRLGRPSYSYDLSAATDRLPVVLQTLVLSFFTGARYAVLWELLLTARSWFLRTEPILYKVGQPIGAYSSWAMLALTHHVLVQVAAMRVGWTRWFPFYALLGDDIVIADEIVAKSYYALIISLGMEINLSKSVVSESGFCEFAKRWSTPFSDLSPVGAAALLKAFRNGSFLVGLYQDLRDKHFNLFPYQVVGSFTKVLAYYTRQSQKAAAFASVLATLSPTGSYSLPLADWIALANQPRVWGGWLPPGLAHAVLWTITSFNRMERDQAIQKAQERLDHFYANWIGVAKAYPGLVVIFSPGFWIYILTLIELTTAERVAYSTKSIRDNTDWSHFTTAQMNELLAGIDFDWGPLAEALDSKNDVSKAAKLRSRILKTQKSWSPDPGWPGTYLTVRDP